MAGQFQMEAFIAGTSFRVLASLIALITNTIQITAVLSAWVLERWQPESGPLDKFEWTRRMNEI